MWVRGDWPWVPTRVVYLCTHIKSDPGSQCKRYTYYKHRNVPIHTSLFGYNLKSSFCGESWFPDLLLIGFNRFKSTAWSNTVWQASSEWICTKRHPESLHEPLSGMYVPKHHPVSKQTASSGSCAYIIGKPIFNNTCLLIAWLLE